MQSLAIGALSDLLGKYAHDIDQKSLHISILKGLLFRKKFGYTIFSFEGDVELSNVRLKVDAFQELGLPFTVKGGFIAKCNLKAR